MSSCFTLKDSLGWTSLRILPRRMHTGTFAPAMVVSVATHRPLFPPLEVEEEEEEEMVTASLHCERLTPLTTVGIPRRTLSAVVASWTELRPKMAAGLPAAISTGASPEKAVVAASVTGTRDTTSLFGIANRGKSVGEENTRR